LSVTDITWREVDRGRQKSPALAVTHGLLIAAPLVILFCALFGGGRLLRVARARRVRLPPAKVFAHLFLTLIFSWITTGLLWVALTTRVPRKFEIERWDRLSLGAVEVGIVLGLQDILFLAFVVQVR
jgi:hypothetical protein